ncbi:MAG: beta-N-acetylglucosaminidase [Anaerolineaceae bacterium]|nr:beta-N-acetylglucosaminidase [Anaerolineaceae bacterium]
MNQPAIIPQPRSLATGSGAFEVNADTRIIADSALASTAGHFADWLRGATGFALPVEAAGDNAANTIRLVVDPAADTGEEGYQLTVTADQIEVRAADTAGVFYGTQTLRQLLPVAVESDSPVSGVSWVVPALTIQDGPRFRWRGLHLDVGRHLFPVAFIKKYIDLMALYKLNTFHWHLTEDQGWRIEIKQYPKLTEVGAWREASPYPADRTKLDGQRYGGFYTQDEVREIVAYAQARSITVVPEIEMPGHAVAALASYPELGCVGEGYKVRTYWGIADDVYCAGNEDVYTFLENVLTEVLDLFPSEFIHIGGDECPKVRWEVCPKCQAKIKQEGLKDEHELQSYFIRRMEKFLNDKGRRLIGWDEILEGGLAPNATVMSWRGAKGGIEAASAGHDVVMTPNTHCYFDYYQAEDTENEPPAIGRYLPLDHVYMFNPTDGVPADKAHHVIGGQGSVWTEYLPTSELVEYMAYPRTLALAETVWSDLDERDYDEFSARLQQHLKRLDKLNVNYRDPGK